MKIFHYQLLMLIFIFTGCSKNDTSTNHLAYPGSYKTGQAYKQNGETYKPMQSVDKNYTQTGKASWYGKDFHNKLTANGDIFNRHHLTAAHKTLPLPSLIKVTNLRNNKELILLLTDRGPFVYNRILDVSEKAAEILGFKTQGITDVKIQYLEDETNKFLETIKLSKKNGSKAQATLANNQKLSINRQIELLNIKYSLLKDHQSNKKANLEISSRSKKRIPLAISQRGQK